MKKQLIQRRWVLLAGIPAMFVGASLSGCGGSKAETVATVGGQAISRDELRGYLETTQGEAALRQFIDYNLVMQELQKKGLSVSDDEVTKALNERLEKVQPAQRTDLQRIMDTEGYRRDTLRQVSRYELAIDKILTSGVKVDEAGLKKWFETNRTRYDKPARVQLGVLATSTKPRSDVLSRELKAKTKTFKQLVEEQQKAADPLARANVEESPEYPVAQLPQVLGPQAAAAVSKLKPGEFSAPLKLSAPGQPPLFLIVRLNKREAALKSDFKTLRAQIEKDYKMEQAVQAFARKNPMAAQQAAQTAFDPSGGGGDIQRAILTAAATDLRARLRAQAVKASSLQISDTTYAPVLETIKAEAATTPTPPPAMMSPGMAPGGAPGGAMAPSSAPRPSGGAAKPAKR